MKTKLYWRSIKNEIDAVTYKIAAIRVGEGSPDVKAEMQTGLEVMEENYCYRKVDEAIFELQSISGIITHVERQEEEDREELSDRLHKTVVSWDIDVDMERAQQMTDEQLTALYHRFVILKVLYEWLIMTGSDAAKDYQTEYLSIKNNVERMSFGVPRKKKRKPYHQAVTNIEIEYE